MPDFKGRIMSKKLRELDGVSADDILLSCKITSYPVDIQAILDKLGVNYAPMDFSELESQNPDVIKIRGSILGAVTVVGDVVNIYYSKDSTENRKRFTLAHELAHCCLHAPDLRDRGHIEFRLDTNSPTLREEAANIFAGQLLIPEKPLIEIYKQLLIPASDVIANEFKVSTHVMEARLTYLGLGFYSPQNYSDTAGDN